MKTPETLVINKIFTRDGEALINVEINESATPLNGFAAFRAIKKNGQRSTNTVYISVDEIRGIEVSDEMQPLLYDFIRPRQICVKE